MTKRNKDRPEPERKAEDPEPRNADKTSKEEGRTVGEGKMGYGKGLDVGTVNLVAAEQNEQGEVVLRLKRNAFIDVPVDAYTKNMLTRLKVPYVVQGKKM